MNSPVPHPLRDWTIYKITNPNNRVYIGITSNFNKRMGYYKCCKCRNQTVLYRSLLKYGFAAHSVEIVETFTSTLDYALAKEMFWIRSYMANYSRFPSMGGMNVTDGGIGSLGKPVSEETKEKLRKANLGKKYSDETKKKLSEIRRGKKINRVFTDEQKMAMREMKKGFKHTPEAKAKISAASIGNKHCLGRKHTDEWKAAMSERMKGNKYGAGSKRSEEHKAAISKANSKKRK